MFQYPNQNAQLKRHTDFQDKVHFYSADTKNGSIIAYGDIERKRTFKITWNKDVYFAYKMRSGKYNYIGQSESLEGAKGFCLLTI